jgi:hypothetical protein
MPTKKDILTQALDARNQEVMGYQINIDNYTRAIARIAEMGDSELEDFRVRLAGLLAAEKLEQKKATVIRDVIAEQLQEIEALTAAQPTA